MLLIDFEMIVVIQDASREVIILVSLGVYCCGWVATGPVGVILSTMNDSFRLSRVIADDIKQGRLNVGDAKGGNEAVLSILKSKSKFFCILWSDQTLQTHSDKKGHLEKCYCGRLDPDPRFGSGRFLKGRGRSPRVGDFCLGVGSLKSRSLVVPTMSVICTTENSLLPSPPPPKCVDQHLSWIWML